jgi:hypothetical protein
VFEAVGLEQAGEGVSVPDAVEALLAQLGDSFTELDSSDPDEQTDILRVLYVGGESLSIPDGRVAATIRDGDKTYGVRLYDRGWTPITGKHVPGTPENSEPINRDAADRVVNVLQQYGK